jgi:DNA-binding CsgD family transcriptional regulator
LSILEGGVWAAAILAYHRIQGETSMSASKPSDRRAVLAVCAVALASAVGSSSSTAASETRAIEKLQQYCAASWRNAGIRREEWDDCTQQALAELLEQIRHEGLPTAIEDSQSIERRELNRTVWRLVQRWRRAPRHKSFDDGTTFGRSELRGQAGDDQQWTQVIDLAAGILSDRQLRILEMTRDGWRTAEIADHLSISTDRVSDEKYKAVAKLRARITARAEKIA